MRARGARGDGGRHRVHTPHGNAVDLSILAQKKLAAAVREETQYLRRVYRMSEETAVNLILSHLCTRGGGSPSSESSGASEGSQDSQRGGGWASDDSDERLDYMCR